MDEAMDEREALLRVTIVEALLQELADEQGTGYTLRVLLGEAAPPPRELLRDLADARRDLALLRRTSTWKSS